MSTCRSCGAEILWAVTERGKRIPLDAEPVEIPRGLFRLLHQPGSLDGKPVEVLYALPVDHVYQSHFASCPNADKHRKRQSSYDPTTESGPS